MKTIHLMSGIPGSGKSYYLDHCIGEDSFNCILHRDDIRAQLRVACNKPDEYFPVSKKEEYNAWILACTSVIIANPEATDFWFDQTTLRTSAAAKFYDALRKCLHSVGISISDFNFTIEVINTDFETCVDRNSKRVGFEKIPIAILEKMKCAPGMGEELKDYLKVDEKAKLTIHKILEQETIEL